MAEPEPKYADFDGFSSRYTEWEVWVLHSDHWVEINHASHGMNAQQLTKAEFAECFPGTPPLPPTAVRRGETVTMREELAKEHVDFDKVAKEQELKPHSEGGDSG